MTFIPQEHILHCSLSFGHGIFNVNKKPPIQQKMNQTTDHTLILPTRDAHPNLLSLGITVVICTPPHIYTNRVNLCSEPHPFTFQW